MTKEAVYDAEINPLMAQIIAICKRERIAMVASFAVPNETDADLFCTTSLLDTSHEPPQVFLAALNLILHGFYALTVRMKDAGCSQKS